MPLCVSWSSSLPQKEKKGGGDKRSQTKKKSKDNTTLPKNKYATLCERSARLSRPARSISVERGGAGRASVAEANHGTISIIGTRIRKIRVLAMLMTVIIAVGWQA